MRFVIVSPLTVEERVVGTLQVFAPSASAGLVRAADEVADWVSGQLELAELDASRTRLMEAEVRALRAQISPHFVYNSLTAIASFVRTDPERARELLLEFADFTRYSFRRHGEFTTLAEELSSIERYLVLEKARFGDRLHVTLRVAPEVLPVVVPFLCLQPLVENAVRHGLEQKHGPGRIEITAEDFDREAVISVEDDGVGEDPERVRRALAGDGELDSVGLGNVDERLRSAFGDDYGLVVETAPGAGTRVTVRVPEVRPWSAPMTTSPGSAAPRTSSLRVLVVDDEPPGARRAGLAAAPRPARRRGEHDRLGHRGAAAAGAGRCRRGVHRHPDARAHRASTWPGCWHASRRRRRSSSSPPTTTTPSTPSSSTPSTTSSSRCARTGSPRRYAGWSTRPAARAPTARTRSRSSSAASPGSSRAPRCATSRRTGDYARLHTAAGSHLIRIPLATLEEEWRDAGFVRIHRSLLVSLPHVGRGADGRRAVHRRRGRGRSWPVSRRHTRELRDLLVRTGATGRRQAVSA